MLGQKIGEPCCTCTCNEYAEIPAAICNCIDGDVIMNGNNARLYISFGIFSVIRIVRPAQLLIQATDYSVPDKECAPATSDENPCALFRTMAFPVNQFKISGTCPQPEPSGQRGGCGCHNG